MNVFNKDHAYAAHMRNENGLPAWDVSREIITSTQPVETDFDGAVRVYDIVPMENEVDSLALFVTKRRYRRTNTSKYYVGPRKAQLSAKEVLEKEKADGTEKVITIFTNCKMLAVDVHD